MLKPKNRGNQAYKVFDFLHRHIIIIIIAIVVISGAISTVAIVRGDRASGSETEEGVTYEEMNTVYLAMDEVETLNPLSSQDSDVYYITQLLFSSLFVLDDTLNIEPDLVSDYTADSATGSVELTLRNDAKFSDGSALTASDVSYTINTILSIGETSPYYSYVSKIDSVQVSGNRKLTITFENPQDAALDNLVFPIVSRSDYDRDSNKVLGSGPYRYVSYDSGKSLLLSPNDNYYGEKAENRLEFKVIPDKSKATGLMTVEAITAYVSREQDADVDAEDKDLQVEKICSSEMEYLGFNFSNKNLAQKEVRQAIATAIDTNGLIEENYGGSAVQSDCVYFPGFLGTNNEKDVYETDQKRASELLSEAGYTDSNENGILENEKGEELELTILTNRNQSSRADTADSIASALREIGIDVKVRKLSWSSYREAVADGDFDLYLGGYKFDKKYNLKSMFRKSNPTGYDNETVRSYVNQLETCLSADEQKTVFEKLKPILTDELPYYCLCYKTYAFITVEHFTTEALPTFFDIYRGCGAWTWQRTITVQQEDETN